MDHRKGYIIGAGGLIIALIVILITYLGNLIIGNLDFLSVVIWIAWAIGSLFGFYGVMHFSIWEAEDFYNRFYGKNED